MEVNERERDAEHREMLNRQEEANTATMAKLEEIQADWAMCRRAASGGGVSTPLVHKIEIPKPKTFGGARNAKEVDNFIWGLSQYFEATNITDEAVKIRTSAMYLSDTAMLWWRRRHGEIGRKLCVMDSFEDFKRELKKQFYPENALDDAKGQLRRLKQTGGIREYVRDFTTLILEVPSTTEEDSQFNFIDGLQQWAKVELRRRNVQDLSSAIAVAESLTDYTSKESSRPKETKTFVSPRSGGGERWKARGTPDASASQKGKTKEMVTRDTVRCFVCAGPHWARECPQKRLLNAQAVVKQRELKEQRRLEEQGARCGSMKLLKALKARPRTRADGQMFVDIILNGTKMTALVNTGASHNFLSPFGVRSVGIKPAHEGGALKTVNSVPIPITGVANGVETSLGEWTGWTNWSIVNMDDYNVVLGMEFFDQTKAILIPYANQVCISDDAGSCVVSTRTTMEIEERALSALQFKRGMHQEGVSYLAILKEFDDEVLSAPTVELDEVQSVLNEFEDVMPDALPTQLPPRRGVDHEIELEAGAKPPAMCPYRMAPPELAELRSQLRELLVTGLIRPSKSLRMCIDYRALNKITIKNKYPIPLIADLFDQLGTARYFTKLDLRSGYYQVRIKEGDKPKTTCVTRYGSYEYLVMPFGLTNAPATFCTLMNKVFQDYLDKFIVVYLDDIVIYSNTLGEHLDHLKLAFALLRENQLFVKREKCTFASNEVMFLGHRIRDGLLMMDGAKVVAIQDWEPPKKVPELRSFLGLVNYYRWFIKSYSSRAAKLTDMLKKNKPWEWDAACQSAFDDLKDAVAVEPLLVLPDCAKPFEVHTDASDFAIGGVLMQDNRPVAFESRKLNETERWYTVQEKEMTAVVHCLRVWRHYLLGSFFVVMTDNIATSYFQTQKKLSPKQARWQDFLAEFHYSLEYRPGKVNVVADALSRKASLAALSRPLGTLVARIKEGLVHDPLAKSLITMVEEKKTRKFWLVNGLLYAKSH
ncbi:uncharacterized protein LOC133780099 [Humulus lupulus]|uniref:uncharacterized protein LOC133780099 n=1 Tax=Humulus lupulus TaxID=3486 RepID=UPI002B40CA5A|nr:uncharacterized protein LOC133780099 [Humulus lupulus]